MDKWRGSHALSHVTVVQPAMISQQWRSQHPNRLLVLQSIAPLFNWRDQPNTFPEAKAARSSLRAILTSPPIHSPHTRYRALTMVCFRLFPTAMPIRVSGDAEMLMTGQAAQVISNSGHDDMIVTNPPSPTLAQTQPRSSRLTAARRITARCGPGLLRSEASDLLER